jgi:diketogulonate reductase-like aldo/keto reductase
MILEETYTLANGVEIPKLGLGTWLISNEAVVQGLSPERVAGYVAHPPPPGLRSSRVRATA